MNLYHVIRCRISPWPFVVASIMLAASALVFMSGFSRVHWQLIPLSGRLTNELKSALDKGYEPRSFKSAGEAREWSDRLRNETHSLLDFFGWYRTLGILSFVLALLSFLGKPRWAGLIALPFGLLALDISSIIM